MEPLSAAGKAIRLSVVSFWYFVIMMFVRIKWTVPGLVGCLVTGVFYFLTRKSGEFKFRFWLSVSIGALIVCVLSIKLGAPVGVVIANTIIMPLLVGGGIVIAHEI